MAKTLLQMAGADPRPAPLSSATLVVIDAQREYLDGALPLDGIEPALDRLAELLAKARAAGAPVIHIAHKGRAGGLFDRDGAGGQIVDQAKPLDGEAVFEKPLPNSFAKTDLEAQLRAIGRPNLILAGFMTHMCVSSTARAALDLGFPVTVASDAAATRALPDGLGGEIAGAVLHRAELAALGDRFACVATVAHIAAS
jgi:nicotinamidase-related amidase